MTLQSNTQITPETVGMLKAGDVLRCRHWGLMRFDRFDDSERRAFMTGVADGQVRLLVPADKMTYIGPDLGGGWIGWSGGENPVPADMMVTIRCKDGSEDTNRADWWTWSSEYAPIIALRPAASSPSAVGVGEILESVSPEGLRVRADMVRDKLNDSGSCARHLELAADEIERLQATPTPAPSADHIADAGKMVAVDWERVGPKLVEALEYVKYHSAIARDQINTRKDVTLQDAGHLFEDFGTRARAALAAATPRGK